MEQGNVTESSAGLATVNEFIATVIKGTFGLVLFISIFVFKDNRENAIALFLGAAWNCLNFYVIKELIVNAITLGKRNYRRLVVLSGAKFPLLYGSGALLLYYFPVIPLVLGSGLTLAVLMVNAAIHALGLRRENG